MVALAATCAGLIAALLWATTGKGRASSLAAPGAFAAGNPAAVPSPPWGATLRVLTARFFAKVTGPGPGPGPFGTDLEGASFDRQAGCGPSM